MPSRARGRKAVDWVGLVQVAVILTVSTGLWLLYKTHRADTHEWNLVTDWLRKEGLEHCQEKLYSAEIDSLEKIASLDVSQQVALQDLDEADKFTLQRAAQRYRDEGILEQWLLDQQIRRLFDSILDAGIHSIEELTQASEAQILKASSFGSSPQDYTVLQTKILELNLQKAEHAHVKDELGQKFAETLHSHKWSIGGLIMFTLFIGMLLVVINMNYASYSAHAAHSKRSILEFVTGKYLAIQFCKVSWEWQEPQVVGKTMTFRIKFYQRNGRPYPISPKDNLLVEIMQGSAKIPPTVQLGGSDPSEVNTARVAFTVHRSGEYRIAIMIGAKHIRGSPFVKKFQAGTLDPSKTGFVSQCSIVACTRNMTQRLLLEPRDEYGNLCSYSPDADHGNAYQITVSETSTQKSWSPRLQVTYDRTSGRIVLTLRLEREGCYHAVATYSGVKLKNGEFTILVLTEGEAATFSKNMAKKSHNVLYEARLLSCCYDRQQKAKKVFCYVSPKQLTIKEFYLKIIPKRLFTFRVCPSTKFHFKGINNQYDTPVLVIDDGCQAPVELAAKDRNIIAATFTSFLLKNIGGSETFKDKQDFFNHEVRQLHSKRPHDKMSIKVSRQTLLENSMKATKHFTNSDWCRNFEIVFQGEEGLDWGGLRKEWFEILCVQLFDPAQTGLFKRFKATSQGLVHPNPSRAPHLKPKFYEFAGKIVGKCLYESALGGSYRQLVKARFSRSFLAQLIGLRVNYKYFEHDDPELYVTKIRFIEENDVNDMDLVFAEEEYKDGKLDKVIELVPNGSKIPVTNHNKLRYLDALAQYKLASSIKDEIEAFLKGLNELIPDNLLSIFDENELELLMCGTGNYSIAEFKEHHIVSGSSLEFQKVLEWFWTIVSGFTKEEMARLLQFTTGCSQLPPGGFAELNPKFQITAAPTYGNLPTAHTCFNQLCLPDYDSMEHMHQSLLIALNEGNLGFGIV